MITPSYAITATERVLPSLALDFTTALLDARVGFTRTGNTATVTDSTGVIVAANADVPRFDYNPTTLVCRGLLIEESRTNLVLNSLIDGSNLTTQSVTVTAAAHTLSFYGTGSIVLSGTASATVTGTGAYPTRITLTFTPTAGSLTLTVTGDVKFCNLELGAFATSFIPTAASQVTRTADLATMTGANFTDWFKTTAGTIESIATTFGLVGTLAADRRHHWAVTNGASVLNDALNAYLITTGFTTVSRNSGGAFTTMPLFGGAQTNGTVNNFVIGFDGSTADRALNTTVAANTAASLTLSNMDRLSLGQQSDSARFLNGHVQKFNYWPMKLTNAEIEAFSK
jgi:hypothetical protein